MPVPLGIITEHGFDEPIGLLGDCHRRIEAFLGALRKVEQQAGDGPLSFEHQKAAEASLAYFRTAGPRHNADEEDSLFPLLRDSPEPAARDAVAAMQSLEEDHQGAASIHLEIDSLYRQWLDSGSLPAIDRQKLAGLLDDLTQMYQRHIAMEDNVIFTLAASVLNPQQLEKVGREMAVRRGIDIDHHNKVTATLLDRPER